MNERIEEMKQQVRRGEHHTQRRAQPISILEECQAENLSWARRAARLTRRQCEAETVVIAPDERIVFTCTLPSEIPALYTPAEMEQLTRGRTVHELGPINNVCADWGQTLARGLLGRREEALKARQRYGRFPGAVEFLDCAVDTIDAVLELAARYAAAAREMGKLDVAEALANVPAYRPRTFHEALQSLRLMDVQEYTSRLAAENQSAIMGTPWLLSIFERAMGMQGMDTFLLNMGQDPDFAEALLKKIAGLCKKLMRHFLDQCGDNLDIICIGDDLGTQTNLMISPAMYRRILKPIHADYVNFIKSHTRAKVFFHTDGDVFNLVDDFVEIGVDILNPIQVSAGKMSNISELKRRFGHNLVFCGAIDTHRILPFGAPEEVRQEVRRVIGILGQNGGYMAATVHTIVDEVPPENILAMADAVSEYGRYPLENQ